jgi:hypothetical protein
MLGEGGIKIVIIPACFRNIVLIVLFLEESQEKFEGKWNIHCQEIQRQGIEQFRRKETSIL